MEDQKYKRNTIVLYYGRKSVQEVPRFEFRSLKPAHYEVYSIQYYVIRFVSVWLQVGGFIRVLDKIERQDITEIIVGYGVNTITLSMLTTETAGTHHFTRKL